jgi:thiol:disulfide interchange protein DsbC
MKTIKTISFLFLTALLSISCAPIKQETLAQPQKLNAIEYKGQSIEAIEAAWVKSVLPNTKIEYIRRSPAVGFYAAFLNNGNIIYVNPSQRLLFFGEIYTSNGENLTTAAKDSFSQTQIKRSIDDEINATELEAVGFGEVDVKSEKLIVMVTSPLCPYCHKADKFFFDNKIAIKRIFLIDLSSFTNEDYRRAIEVMTAVKKEREELIAKWRDQGYRAREATETITIAEAEASATLLKMGGFIDRHNIDGTPYIYLVNRKTNKVERLITGFGDDTGSEITDWIKAK